MRPYKDVERLSIELKKKKKKITGKKQKMKELKESKIRRKRRKIALLRCWMRQ